MTQIQDLPQANDGGNQLDLGALTKFGAVSAALAYATGMLAINTYLHKLGIADFSFAKPKLILTGVLVLITFVLLALLPIFVAWRMAGRRGPRGQTLPPSRKILFLLLFPLIALIAASASLCFGTTTGLGQITVWGVWELLKQRNVFTESLASLVIAAEVYVPICVAAVSAFTAARLFNQAKPETSTSQTVPEWVYFPVAIVLAVISVIGYMYIFSLTFYAAIPQAFGGGKPYFESFVITDDGRCQLQQLGIPFVDEQPNVTKPLPVLHESDTLVAVWLDKKVIPSKDKHQGTEDLGSWNSIVVQLDKKQITATMADPLAKTVPILASPPVPCKTSSGLEH
jgi:hypothetical protein